MTNSLYCAPLCVIAEWQLVKLDRSLVEAETGHLAIDERVEKALQHRRTNIDRLRVRKGKL